MKLNSFALALSSALTFAVLWVACSLIVVALPGMMMDMSGHMIHANFSMMNWTMTFTGFFIGLIAWSLLAGLTGWLVAVFYNLIMVRTSDAEDIAFTPSAHAS